MSILATKTRGLFWWASQSVPNGQFAPDNAVSGELELKKDGQTRLALDLMLPRSGMVSTLQIAFEGEATSNDAICGILIGDTKYVRLSELRRDGATASSSGPSVENFIAIYCLISSSPFVANKEPKIRSTRIPLLGFDEWLNIGSISSTFLKRKRWKAEYKMPSDVKWDMGAFGRAKLVYDISYPYPSSRSSKIELREMAYLFLYPIKRQSIEETVKIFLRAEELLVLLTDSERGIDFPKVYLDGHKYPVGLHFFHFRQSDQAVTLRDCWLRFPAISNSFGTILANWLSQYQECGPGYHLYMGNRRGMQLYPEHKFASFMWGLEAFDRVKNGSVTNAKLTTKINRIVEDVKLRKDKDWLASRLKNADEPSLAERLLKLFSSVDLDFDTKAISDFSKKCGARRNDLSHFGGLRDQDEDYDLFLNEIIGLNRAIDLLYHAIILLDIGVEKKLIKWIFYEGFRSYPFQQILAQAGLKLNAKA